MTGRANALPVQFPPRLPAGAVLGGRGAIGSFSGKYGPCIHFWMLVFDIKDVYIGGADLASDGIVMKDVGKCVDFCLPR